MSPRSALVVIVGLAAVIEDLTRRRISNWTSVGALCSGLIVNFVQKGWTGVLHSILGAAIGFSVFLVFYLLGGMGGGDVKLMAGFGALLGDGRILTAALMTAACGGIFALVYLGGREVARLFKIGTAPSGEKVAGESIPYAPAIAAGALLALVSEM